MPRPWLHIAGVVADEAKRHQYRRVGILGTQYLMESEVYPQQLKARQIEWLVPEDDERERINTAIFRDLVNARFTAETRASFVSIIQKLARYGCEAVVLGCTEIPLIISPSDSPLPTLDSTRLLARAALQQALE